MAEYLQKFKEQADCLATAGVLMSDADLISCTLAGLDPEYLPLTTVIEKDAELTWTDMQASLIKFESKLQQMQEVQMKLAKVTVAPSVNAAFVKNHSQPLRPGYNQSRGTKGGCNGGRGQRGRRSWQWVQQSSSLPDLW
ncbi:hypothetical protein Scep_009662 [Stephania cephalantha]|uniref:Uncharacterized protein n=1 Tax=Stephania cephalantha TaxID=152367 RepID=A0AAP0JU19_9MAGN